MNGIQLVAALLLLATSPALAQTLKSKDVDALPASKPDLIAKYGKDELQFGELRLPEGQGPFPVAVVIHGGCWTKGFATARNTAPLASALTERGIATWNIEYRQVGDDGGGWPGTFLDWGTAVDYLRELAKTEPLDLSRVVAVGHSAGAHAALWVAARHKLPKTSAIRGSDPLPLPAAVAIDGPGDLAAFVGPDDEVCDKPVIAPLMGGTPTERPDRYEEASPYALLPLGVPQYLVASKVLSEAEADKYRTRAIAAGDHADVLSVKNGGHFDIIAPGTQAFDAVEAFILDRALAQPDPAQAP